MSTSDVVKAAQTLANLRCLLSDEARRAEHALFGTDLMRAKALRDLVRRVDETVEGLHPFAFYTDMDVERVLGMSVAVERAKAGDVRSAGALLVALFGPAEREVA